MSSCQDLGSLLSSADHISKVPAAIRPTLRAASTHHAETVIGGSVFFDMTMDAFGRIVQVNEPNPARGRIM